MYTLYTVSNIHNNKKITIERVVSAVYACSHMQHMIHARERWRWDGPEGEGGGIDSGPGLSACNADVASKASVVQCK